jgi:hypothetical protein
MRLPGDFSPTTRSTSASRAGADEQAYVLILREIGICSSPLSSFLLRIVFPVNYFAITLIAIC